MTKRLLYSFVLFAAFFVANGQDRALAMSLYNESKYAEAAVIFEKLYRSQPDEANYAALLDCYKALKDYDEAASLINEVLIRNLFSITHSCISRNHDGGLGIIRTSLADRRNATTT